MRVADVFSLLATEDFANMIAPGLMRRRSCGLGTATPGASLLTWFEPLIDQNVTMGEAGDRRIGFR